VTIRKQTKGRAEGNPSQKFNNHKNKLKEKLRAIPRTKKDDPSRIIKENRRPHIKPRKKRRQ